MQLFLPCFLTPASETSIKPHTVFRRGSVNQLFVHESCPRSTRTGSGSTAAQQRGAVICLLCCLCVRWSLSFSLLSCPSPSPGFSSWRSWKEEGRGGGGGRRVTPFRLCNLLSVSCWFTPVLREHLSVDLIPDLCLAPDLNVWSPRSRWGGLWYVPLASRIA